MNQWKEKALKKLKTAEVSNPTTKKEKLNLRQRIILARAIRKRKEMNEKCGWIIRRA